MATTTNTALINSIVGPGTEVRGELSVNGSARVDGIMHGSLKAKGRVVIGSDARLHCDIQGSSVVVGGVVKGNIVASEEVTLLSSALVLGDIVTTRIRVEEGSFVQGLVMASGKDEDWQARLKRWQDRRSVLKRVGASPEGHSHGQA